MANVQKQFEEFHSKIRMDYKISSTLRDKRDIITKKIQTHLKANKLPHFRRLLQGSYAMKTGVHPIGSLEYDIDVGLRFYFSEHEYAANEARKWILDAVHNHTDKVEEKGPCIRVTYADGFHVDLVIYAVWKDDNDMEQYRLAHKDGWRSSNPPQLLQYVKNARKAFSGTEDNISQTDQFRRCIRYQRRWDDIAIPRPSDSKPPGLAFVLYCAQNLSPMVDLFDESDDLKALKLLCEAVIAKPGRLEARKPSPEYEEMFSGLSNSDMTELKNRYDLLREALNSAALEVDPVEACKILQKVFGDDFPVPPKDDTAEKTSRPAIITSATSA